MKKLLAAILILIGVTSCKKDKDDNIASNGLLPLITDIVADHGCSHRLTINGNYFNSNSVKDSVFIDGVMGTILSASDTQLVVNFPFQNIEGLVTLHSNNHLVIYPDSIHFGVAVISSISPAIAGTGAQVLISGNYFNSDALADSVYFNNIKAKIVSATATQIIAVVPAGVTDGNVVVHTNCQTILSPAPFINSNRGTLYIGSNGGNFYALDAVSGAVKWTFPMNAAASSSPTFANGKVYVGSGYDNNLYALDAVTGQPVWDFRAGPWDGTPIVSQGVLYSAGADNFFYALDAATGTKKWSYDAGYPYQRSSLLYNGDVYVGNDNGYFYNLTASTGTLNWKLFIWSSGNPAAVNGVIYTAGFSGDGETSEVYALDAVTGSVIWTFPISSLSGSSPTIVNGILYIGSGDHHIYAISAGTGQLLWKTEVSWWVSSALQVSGNIIYAAIADGSLAALDLSNGTILWQTALDPNGFSQASPVVAEGVVYVGGYNGNVYAINASTGGILWITNTSGYPVLSSPCFVDTAGNIYHAGDSGDQQ